MNASFGMLPASAQEPAVVGMSVVSMLSLTMIGIPSSGRRSPLRRPWSAARAEIEIRQINGVQPVRVHQLLQLRDRRRVDVNAGELGVRRVAHGADRHRRAGRHRRPG
jgi:hypothetical protein